MKKDAKTFQEVAERCTRFTPVNDTGCGCEGVKNSTCDCTDVSCKNCEHYEPDKVCTLDLYREIVENHYL